LSLRKRVTVRPRRGRGGRDRPSTGHNMPVNINTNLASVRALTNLSRSARPLASTFAKLASGLRITRAADDAAGFGLAENLSATGGALRQAARNVNDGLSFVQTAEGYANEVGVILKRMKELATQSASDTLADAERAYVQAEYSQMKGEIDRIAYGAEFNGVKLGSGAVTQVDVQVGAFNNADNRITISLLPIHTGVLLLNTVIYLSSTGLTLGTVGPVNLGSAAGARDGMARLDYALSWMNTVRAGFGAAQNRLESVGRSLETYTDNVTAAESRIRDADFAFESAELSRYQIMQQAGVAILGQANQLSQAALQLIR
jgi:flagellin